MSRTALRASEPPRPKQARREEALRLNPTDAFAFAYRGNAYLNKGDNDRAIADLSEAIRLDSKDATDFFNRGIAYGKKGDYERAIADFSEAIQLDPRDAFAFCYRGSAKLKIHDSSGNADIAKARRLNASVCR
jgi:tetratricopeptide (TPR) repeat protein